MTRTTTSLLLAMSLVLAVPATASAQVIDPLPPIPCPWWDCGATNEVVVEEYRVDTTIENSIATTRITQVLRNDGRGIAEGEFLHPIPADAAVTGLILWIDGVPVEGEVLDGDAARRTYEEIVRRTLDPALLEYVDDGLLRLSVFPIPAGTTRKVEIEYRQVLATDGGLAQYRQSLGREHGSVPIERIVVSIAITEDAGLKTIYSPTHAVAVDRDGEKQATVGLEGSGAQTSDLTLYYSTDAEAVSIDVVSFRDGEEGWFLLLASPGIAAAQSVAPKDVVVVVDVSGSMEGEKMDQAREAANFVLDQLNTADRFEVIAFSNAIDSFGGALMPSAAAPDAAGWVDGLSAAGATDINRALTEAFSLAESERPLYVIFLTDGLPTEGIVDTTEILTNLRDRGSASISLFAFGVGFDVDTVLLDTLAQDHHGTTQYVVPGEDIGEAVAALSAKVASPVLTGVDVAVDGVVVSDLYPAPMPDIFSGEQLVVAGRYEGWGPAAVTLSGRIRNEPIEIRYDDVRFTAAGGDDAIPGLWATRKIGALLRDIRLNGPNAETIDQIVRISIRHGIVTPYTSYLVTEPAPFGEEAIDIISQRANASTTTLAPSGEASVTAADAASELFESDVASEPSALYRDVVATAGGRTLRYSDGIWIDTTYDPAMQKIRIAFGSDDYFTLAATSSSLAAALAVGQHVIVVVDGVAYEVVDADAPADPLPEIPPPEVTTTSTSQPIVLGSGPDAGESGISTGAVALLAAMTAVAALAVVAARKG